jgi:hypothetical protein
MLSLKRRVSLLLPCCFKLRFVCVNSGVLAWLDKQGKRGANLDEIVEHSTLNEYAVSVLLDMGLSGRIVTHKEGLYYLVKVGHFLLHDTMTRVNMILPRTFVIRDYFTCPIPLKMKNLRDYLYLANGRLSIRHCRNYPHKQKRVGSHSIITILTPLLMPHCHIYSQAIRQNCTMSAAIRVNGLYAVAGTVKMSPLHSSTSRSK